MRTTRRHSVFALAAALAVLALGTGCYNPRKDIDAFRPQAERYFAALEKIGRSAAAQPSLTPDTMGFPDPRQLRFEDGPGGTRNVEIIHVEELSDFGQTHIYDHVIDNDYYLPAYALLHGQPDPHVGKVTKEVVSWRFHQLLDVQYLVVLRTRHVYAEVTGNKEFKGGQINGVAFLYEVGDTALCYGGFMFTVQSSNEISLTVHGDQEQQNIDRKVAVMKDLDGQAEKLIHQKLRSSLPGAGIPAYW